jgi:hypothetical protein
MVYARRLLAFNFPTSALKTTSLYMKIPSPLYKVWSGRFAVECSRFKFEHDRGLIFEVGSFVNKQKTFRRLLRICVLKEWLMMMY